MAEHYHLEQPDGSKVQCGCGCYVYEMQQDKMPWCAVVKCVMCGTLWLGCAPDIKARAWLN